MRVFVAPMWRLGLSGGGGGGGGGESYPERPDEPDCIYYLRTGVCGYGSRCRFNHPRDRGAVNDFSVSDSSPYSPISISDQLLRV